MINKTRHNAQRNLNELGHVFVQSALKVSLFCTTLVKAPTEFITDLCNDYEEFALNKINAQNTRNEQKEFLRSVERSSKPIYDDDVDEVAKSGQLDRITREKPNQFVIKNERLRLTYKVTEKPNEIEWS